MLKNRSEKKNRIKVKKNEGEKGKEKTITQSVTKKRIEELSSSKVSTSMCLLSYEIPSFLTIIEMI